MIQEDSTFEKKLGIKEALFVGTFEELKKNILIVNIMILLK